MRLIRNPLNEVEVEKIIENIAPACENAKRYAMHDNERTKNIVEVLSLIHI